MGNEQSANERRDADVGGIPVLQSEENPVLKKVFLIGESGTGAKTTLLDRLVTGEWHESYVSTIGCDHRVSVDGKSADLQIWDTGTGMTPSLSRGPLFDY
jgi:GTPase SAR1 family protein